MKISFLKRLVKDDFAQKDQQLVGKIGFILNPAIEQLSLALKNNLTFADNIACQILSISVAVDSTGAPINTTSFTSTLASNIQHLWVTRAVCATPGTYPTGAPFISFSQNGTAVTINNVTGLPANKAFTLTIIAAI